MITIDLPQYKKPIEIENLMLDYNGTLAIDGVLIPKVEEMLIEISKKLNIYIITADTFGLVKAQLKNIPCNLKILESTNQSEAKLNFLNSINSSKTICIGNGFNDSLMLKNSIIGISVIQKEGASVNAINSADIVCFSIIDALELINNPLRIKATLRN
jgi:soluble P-type ATPase